MSECISEHGEFAGHVLDEFGDRRFVCCRCDTFDREAALRELERVEDLVRQLRGTLAQHDAEWRWVGPCDGGCITEPEETCPMHGRELTDWRDIAGEVIGLLNAATESDPFR